MKGCCGFETNNNEATRFRAQMLLNQLGELGRGGVANSQQRRQVFTCFLFTVVDDRYFNRQCSYGKKEAVACFFPWLRKCFFFFLSFTQQDKQSPEQLSKESRRFSRTFFLLSQLQTTHLKRSHVV
jgi:hypothetical protein